MSLAYAAIAANISKFRLLVAREIAMAKTREKKPINAKRISCLRVK
jgi:hypothetical protein